MENNNSLGVLYQFADEGKNAAGSYARPGNMYYQEKWRSLVQSKLYLAFIISFMIFAICTGISMSFSVVRELFAVPFELETFIWFVTELAAVEIVALGMALLIVGLWLVRAKAGSSGKSKIVGLGMVFWTYGALFAITIICFIITLPIFSEWLPYSAAYDKPLQIIYCIYVFMGIDSALTMVTVKKMQENLWLHGGTTGPVIALAVMYILRGLITMGIAFLLDSVRSIHVILGLLSILPIVLIVILLFRYRAILLKVE